MNKILYTENKFWLLANMPEEPKHTGDGIPEVASYKIIMQDRMDKKMAILNPSAFGYNENQVGNWLYWGTHLKNGDIIPFPDNLEYTQTPIGAILSKKSEPEKESGWMIEAQHVPAFFKKMDELLAVEVQQKSTSSFKKSNAPSVEEFKESLKKAHTETFNDAYNLALNHVQGLFNPIFSTKPTADNLLVIITAFRDAVLSIEKLKR